MKKILFTMGAILFYSFLYSQIESIQRLNIKSPEVAAFERVGEIPVDIYTGVPKISIPIWQVKSGDIELPISLDYHATAIKVDQEASWVGLNWLLNAGGVISTQVAAPAAGEFIQDWKHLFEEMSFLEYKVGDH